MGDLIQRALVDRGHRVRVYTPYGAMLPGMAYLVRRLLENTSNESFLKASFAERAAIDDLLRDPEEIGAMLTRTRRPATEPPPARGLAEPAAVPQRAADRLCPVREPRGDAARRSSECGLELGRRYPLLIGGEEVGTEPRAARFARPEPQLAGGGPGGPGRGRARAKPRWPRPGRRSPAWAATPARGRAAVLIGAAAIMRNRRFELAAWEVYECGKPWAEADADVAEAIDFCEFYAREMIRLAEPRRRDVPGETNFTEHIPRGVAVVIPPWNFPLAIPTGMTVAALVAGNTVILKPAEQSPVITWHLAQCPARSRAARRAC